MNPVTCSLETAAVLGKDVSDAHLAYKDAIYFSGHKFLGGPGGCDETDAIL